jgi:hypothetical protein
MYGGLVGHVCAGDVVYETPGEDVCIVLRCQCLFCLGFDGLHACCMILRNCRAKMTDSGCRLLSCSPRCDLSCPGLSLASY